MLKEQGDADYANAIRILPVGPLMETGTSTAVKMEAADKDQSQDEMTVLPRCY
jgi:hypothetical protein